MAGVSSIEEQKRVNELKKDYQDISKNKEVKIKRDIENNNIFANIFSNVNVFEKRNNVFTVNDKTYMLKYNNHLNEEDFSISYHKQEGEKFVDISPWHDFPLKNDDGTFNMVVEISKFTFMKLEINLKSKYNVIKQDLKKGKLRYYNSSIYWNYGALPQTYEYKKHIYKCLTKDNDQLYFTGDSDPLDIVDIGQASLKMGQVVPVKILGAFTLIDEGELDWKIIAINKEDKHFDQINCVEDVEKFYPSCITMLLEWFRYYKMPDSKKLNLIAKELYSKKESEDLIKKTHDYYLEFLQDVKKLKENVNDLKSEKNVSLDETTCVTDIDDEMYNTLLRGIKISYHKADNNYKPSLDLWVP